MHVARNEIKDEIECDIFSLIFGQQLDMWCPVMYLEQKHSAWNSWLIGKTGMDQKVGKNDNVPLSRLYLCSFLYNKSGKGRFPLKYIFIYVHRARWLEPRGKLEIWFLQENTCSKPSSFGGKTRINKSYSWYRVVYITWPFSMNTGLL